MKIVGIILGILLIISGIYCAITPLATFAALGWLVGAVMVVEGVGGIMNFFARRKLGLVSGWTLVGAIASLALGICVLFNIVLRVGIDTMIAYLVSIWLIVIGIMRAVAAIHLRNERHAGSQVGSNWGLILALGILITIIGVICFFYPLLAMEGVGIWMGFGIASTGASMVAGSITARD